MDSTLSLTTGQNIKFTSQGIAIDGEMTLPQWTDFLNTIHSVKDAYHCALADTITYGRDKFGDAEVSLALEQAAFDLNDVIKAGNIAQLSLTFRQTYHLSSEHYFVLSKMTDTAEQVKWANLAVNNKLTAFELKRSIEAGKLIRTTQIQSTSGQGSGFNTIQGIAFKASQWEKTMGGLDNIIKLPPEQRRSIIELLTPTITMVAAIEKSLSNRR
ncbi:MAG: hypothetical protein V4819_16350 [Verrucomicrobiota bacterium]